MIGGWPTRADAMRERREKRRRQLVSAGGREVADLCAQLSALANDADNGHGPAELAAVRETLSAAIASLTGD